MKKSDPASRLESILQAIVQTERERLQNAGRRVPESKLCTCHCLVVKDD